MRVFSEILVEIGHWIGLLVLFVNGVYFLMLRFDKSSLFQSIKDFLNPATSTIGGLVLIVWGVLSVLIAIFFLRNIVIMHRSRARIMSAGPRGPIWISPTAVRDFVLKIVEEQLQLQNARVSLRILNDGVALKVRGSIPLTGPLTELGERIQESVKSQLESRIGINVKSVEVYARSITTTAGETGQEAADEYTPLGMPDRDRYE